MKEENRKKAPASHANRVFRASDVNNGVVDVEEKMLNEKEWVSEWEREKGRETVFKCQNLCSRKKITNTIIKKVFEMISNNFNPRLLSEIL